jgi:hypothetical protein
MSERKNSLIYLEALVHHILAEKPGGGGTISMVCSMNLLRGYVMRTSAENEGRKSMEK